jgi:glucose/mannose-6-phosphate isomerase
MLDDTATVERIDQSGMLSCVNAFPLHIKETIDMMDGIQIFKLIKVDNIIISGMGGSGIAGEIIAALYRDKIDVPVFVNREYDLPRWARKDTLTIFLSYSGNTEETLSAFKVASQKKCACICITSGGKLREYAKKRGVTVISIPSDLQPRAAIGYMLFSLILVLQKTGILTHQIDADVAEAISVSQEVVLENSMKVEESSNPSKQMARQLLGSIPQIYGWGIYAPVATRWRYQFNENSKLIARTDVIPECNHNDIVGWGCNPEASQYFSCILFRDRTLETIYLGKRFDFMKSVFNDSVQTVVDVYVKGHGALAKIISLILLGDYVSCYLAVLRQIDPTPIDVITELKQQLQKI